MLITNAKALLGAEFVSDTDVRFVGGIITEIGKNLHADYDEVVIDAAGKILAPGFCDVHIHGFADHDTMDGADGVLGMSANLVKHGTTSFLPTTVSAPEKETRFAVDGVREAMKRQKEARELDAACQSNHMENYGSTILGCHMEGPFINDAKRGAQDPNGIFAPDPAMWDKMAGEKDGTVRLMTVAPEMDGAETLIKYVLPDCRIAVGHTDASAEKTAEAADWGCTQITHMYNAMNALNHRKPGVPGTALADDRYSTQIITDLVHVHPTAIKLCYNAKGYEHVIMITDCMRAGGMPDGDYMLGALPVVVKNSEARLHDGTLAGSTLTMDRAVRNCVKKIGLPLEEVLQMASRIPCESIGQNDRGVIEVGKKADLVLLNDDLEIVKVFVDGVVGYEA